MSNPKIPLLEEFLSSTRSMTFPQFPDIQADMVCLYRLEILTDNRFQLLPFFIGKMASLVEQSKTADFPYPGSAGAAMLRTRK